MWKFVGIGNYDTVFGLEGSGILRICVNGTERASTTGIHMAGKTIDNLGAEPSKYYAAQDAVKTNIVDDASKVIPRTKSEYHQSTYTDEVNRALGLYLKHAPFAELTPPPGYTTRGIQANAPADQITTLAERVKHTAQELERKLSQVANPQEGNLIDDEIIKAENVSNLVELLKERREMIDAVHNNVVGKQLV